MEIVCTSTESKSERYTVSELAGEFGGDVYKLCLRLACSREDAEDLFQETFLKAVAQLDKINASGNPKSFLLSIASFTWKSWKRKHARRNRLAPVEPLTEVMQGGALLEERALAEFEAQAVRALVYALPENLRLPTILYYTLEMRIPEVAAVLKLPPGTIKSRLFKARELIRKGLDKNDRQ